MGVVSNFARPGGNATGVSYLNFDLDPRRMQIFKEAVPGLSRVALLVNGNTPSLAERDLELYGAASKQYGVVIEQFQACDKAELVTMFRKDNAVAFRRSHRRAGHSLR